MNFQFSPQVRTTFRVEGDKGEYLIKASGRPKGGSPGDLMRFLRTRRQVRVLAKLHDGTQVRSKVPGKVITQFIRSRRGVA